MAKNDNHKERASSVRYQRLSANDCDGNSDDSSEEDLIFTMVADDNLKKSEAGGTVGEGIHRKTNSIQALMHILKANIGTGILAIPSAFKNSGLYAGLFTMPIFALICTHCMHLLVTGNAIVHSRLGTGMLDYPELTEAAFSIGPKPFQKFAKTARWIINLSLTLTQFGFCCVYTLFVAESIKLFTEEVTNKAFDMDVRLFLAMILPLFILISFVRSLSALSLFSAFSNVLLSVGFVAIFVELFNDLPSVDERPKYPKVVQDASLALATFIYTFEGIGVILPLQQDMKEPKKLKGLTGVINTAMMIVLCLNTGVGFFGYLKYGDNIKGSITLNLPAVTIYESIKLVFAVAIFLTYPIQYYVPYNILWPWAVEKYELDRKFGNTWRLRAIDMLVRAVIVCITCGLAAAIPQLDMFISLVGAFAASNLALIFPPLIDICAHWNMDKKTWTQMQNNNNNGHIHNGNVPNGNTLPAPEYKAPNLKYILTKDIIVCSVGLFGFTTGTFVSLQNIVINYNK